MTFYEKPSLMGNKEHTELFYLEIDKGSWFYCIVNRLTLDTVEQYIEESTALKRLNELNKGDLK